MIFISASIGFSGKFKVVKCFIFGIRESVGLKFTFFPRIIYTGAVPHPYNVEFATD